MASPEPERFIPIRINVPADHPALFDGLEAWLRMGLISDHQIRELCRLYLVCAVTVQERGSSPVEDLPVAPAAIAVPSRAASVNIETTTETNIEDTHTPETRPVRASGWVSQFLERLINEVSVIWLLCLGVFLVVISSAVLAASQWQHFSAVGQYGILFGYTIAFVVVGLWIGTQPRLQLTGGMLKIASLLIIPVNFWMMDGFHLLQSPIGIGLAAIAAILLSFATVLLLPRPKTEVLAIINALALSWLHWGWGWSAVPLLATYAGCIGTSLVLLRQQRGQQNLPDGAALGSPEPNREEPDREAFEITPSWLSQLSPTNILLPFAVMLLLFRACVVVQIPLEQLSLAFGICGWLLCWLARRNPFKQVWALIGAGLLIMGWVAGVGAEMPWQTVLVSGLGLWLLGDRLPHRRQPVDLVALVGVGLISIDPLVRLVPSTVRKSIVNACIALFGASGMPDALWSVGLYPYLWCVLALGFWMQSWQSTRLVRTADAIAWLLGGSLVAASLVNPTLRSLSLGLAFLTLIGVLRKRPPAGRALVSIAHALGLAAVFSTLDNIAPELAIHQWGIAALVVMSLEWIVLIFLARRSLWQESTWFAGLGFAGLGYLLLLTSFFTAPWEWRSAALAIPTALTMLLFWPPFRWRTQALGVSVISVVAVQLLTFDATTPRLIGLALGAGLMFLNTVQRPNLLTATLSIGFGVTLGYATGWEIFPHEFQWWVAFSAGLLLALVVLRQVVRDGWAIGTSFKLALDGWTIALMMWTTSLLVGYSLLVSWFHQAWLPNLTWIYPASSFVMLATLGYRLWQKPKQIWLLGVAWTAEVTLICTLAFWLQPLHTIAIATLALGFLSVLLGEAWTRRTGQPYRWSSNLIPLGYGVLGWLLANTEWTAVSGLYTLALAATALGVGRRQLNLRPITVLGLAGLSIGAFEFVLYPLLKAKGGQPGDGFIALGALAIALAIAAVASDRWSTRLLNLPPKSITLFGHIHWGLGTVLLIIPLISSLPLSPIGWLLWKIEMVLLGSYALYQGKQQPIWIYAGLFQLLAPLGQWIDVDNPKALPWASAIASGVSLGLYSLPWERGGWVRTPFKQVALALPLLTTLLTALIVNTSSLLLTGGFYGWMAFAAQTTRLSYIGLAAANWAALRLLHELHLTSRIWGISLVGLSLLFITQVDPALRSPSQKNLRHWLRCFAIGLISTTVLYESDPYFGAGLLAIGLSLGLVLIGLLLRVRAFLYVGTLMFLAKILRIVWLFIADESLVLWALGIALGLLLIWIAATFEARRSQVTALLQYWVAELDQWQ
jgi:hypothetical protein